MHMLMTSLALVMSFVVSGLQSDVELRADIEKLNAGMVAAFKKEPATVAGFYTDTAVMAGGGQRTEGRAAIEAYWKGATMFADWTLEVLHVGGTAEAPWQYGRSRLVSRSGQIMETYFLGLLRRAPSGELRFHVDAYSRDQKTIGAEQTARVTDAWLKSTRGDEATLKRILADPLALLASPPAR
jgi:ketosteroid isomerase-like protein